MSITCELMGINRTGLETFENNSLGNHLFQIASTIGIAMTNSLECTFPDIRKFKDHLGNDSIESNCL